ncbi:hypothetical protein IOD16_27575 [Saccharothrix sp. 6-C]|uniref:hypothetical protein n=1 Tax=Saccharothrix TaxID=2071 RepID=UPI0014770DD7|nr:MULTISPECIES: hypothetical protein [Saccharothrix]QQQ74867.1 hypothetical protein IOD16_27575 [Saccharothrix sp. 6-C]
MTTRARTDPADAEAVPPGPAVGEVLPDPAPGRAPVVDVSVPDASRFAAVLRPELTVE